MAYDPKNYSGMQEDLTKGQFAGREPYIDIKRADGSLEFLNVKPDEKYIVDIIPFKVAGNNYPGYDRLKLKFKGNDSIYAHTMTLWVHRNVGPGNANVVCPAKNYNKPCPICEGLDAQMKSGDLTKDDEEFKSLKAKQRGIYLVADVLDDRNIKIFDYPHYFFSNNLNARLKRVNQEEEVVLLYDISEDGKSIEFYPDAASSDFRRKDGSIPPGNISDITFKDRREGYSESIVDEIPSLDELVVIKAYDEIEAIYQGLDVVEEANEGFEEEDKSSRRERDRGVEEESSRRSPRGEKKEEETEERSSHKDREERRNRRERKENGPKCPFGKTFGKDNLIDGDCDTCEIKHGETFTACTDEYNKKYT